MKEVQAKSVLENTSRDESLCLSGIWRKGANFSTYGSLSIHNNIMWRSFRLQQNETVEISFSLISGLRKRLKNMRQTVAPDHTVQSFRQLQANSREPNTHVMSSTCGSLMGWCNTAYVNFEPPTWHKHRTKAQARMPEGEQHQQCDARLK